MRGTAAVIDVRNHGALIWCAGLCAALSVSLGGALTAQSWVAAFVIGAAVLTAAVVASARAPSGVWAVTIVLLVMVPYYAPPTFGGEPLVPAAALSWVLGLTLLFREGRFRLRLIDLFLGALVLLMLVNVVVGIRKPGDMYRELFLWIGPYVCARAVFSDRRRARMATAAIPLTALLLLPFAVVEWWTGSNVFRHFAYNRAAAQVWAPTIDRLNSVRVETSFGHPIALSMFFSSSALLAVGLALEGRGSPRARLWSLAALALAGVQMLSLSRTGLVVLAVGLGLLIPWRGGLMSRPGVCASIVVTLGLGLAAPPAAGIRHILAGLFVTSGSSEVSASARYRGQLFHEATQSGVLHSLGNHLSAFSGSVDSEYIVLADRWGLFAVAAIAGLVIALSWELVKRRRMSLGLAIAAAAVGNFVGLGAVALITQQQVYIWALVGAAVATGARARRADLLQRPPDEALQ